MTHQPATFGIDIGKHTITVCQAQHSRPSLWPTHQIDMKNPNWTAKLYSLIPREAIVTLEPTGWFYSRPVIIALTAINAKIINITHSAAANARLDRVSTQKTDANDARALAAKAADYAKWGATHGALQHNPELDALNIALRLKLSTYYREIKRRVAAINRISAFAYGIWPALGISRTAYERCRQHQAYTPAQCRSLITDNPTQFEDLKHHATLGALKKLLEALHDAPEPPEQIIDAIKEAEKQQREADERIIETEAQIAQLIYQDEIASTTAAWSTVPSASTIRIATLHAATRCQAHLLSTDEFKAAVGCHPSRQESGVITETRDNKRGYKPAKSALHLWAMNLINSQTDNPVKRYYETYSTRHEKNAIHAARGKLARVLSGIARNQQPYKPDNRTNVLEARGNNETNEQQGNSTRDG